MSELTLGKRALTRQRHERDIVDAAERLLREHGASGMTLRRVAAEVGMAPSAIYRYYTGIEGIFQAVTLRAHERLGTWLRDAPQPEHDRVSVAVTLACYLRLWALDNPHHFMLMFGSDTSMRGDLPLPAIDGPVAAAFWTAVGGPENVRPDLRWLQFGLKPELVEYAGLSAGLIARVISVWTRMIGLINGELLGHYRGLLDDPALHFETQMRGEFEAALRD